MSALQAAIAANRFGMGALPGELDAAARDPRGWLKAQIGPNAAVYPAGDLLSAQQALKARHKTISPTAKGSQKQKVAANQSANDMATEGMREEVRVRMLHAVETPKSFAERWARFWANHFTVAVRMPVMIGVVGPYEREAIRPHVFGSFAGLLRKATFHQGMLLYLDAAQSVGPSSKAAQTRRVGLNENLAREILELHTLGVGSGYTQADIIEFAKALTGWTVEEFPPNADAMIDVRYRRQNQQARDAVVTDSIGQAGFISDLHEPGARTVVGKKYADTGRDQAGAILDDLARHPATARHVATKLARHFVSDTPPASAVEKLAGVFMQSNGDLSTLARAVIDLDEAWAPEQQKFKTPEELAVSVARVAGGQAAFIYGARQVYVSLTQAPFKAPSPAGWPDDAASWAGPDAVMKRLEWANSVSRRMARGASPNDILDAAVGELLTERTRLAVERAESAEQGFTLALMSPEFQRR